MINENEIIKKYKDENPYNNIDYNPVKNDCIAIIVDTRPLDYLDWVIRTVMYHLNWNIRLYGSYNSINVVNSDIERATIPNNIDYNKLFKDEYFWKDFEEEHILVFQHDSFVLRSGIEEFLEYDYIGAPWYWAYGDFKDKRYKDLKDFKEGGNGGFSLRKKSKMIEIINSDTQDYLYEDMYFSNALDQNIDLEIKKRFAVESIFYPDPLGVHQIHRYLNNDQIKNILF